MRAHWLLAALLCVGGCATSTAATPTVYFAPPDPLVQHVVEAIGEARRSIDLAVRDISSPAIAQALLNAAEQGVAIRLVTDRYSAEGPRMPGQAPSQVPALQAAGIPVIILGEPFQRTMHHKFALFDGARLWVGSWNWREEDAASNWEDVLILDDPAVLRQFQRTFETLWAP